MSAKKNVVSAEVLRSQQADTKARLDELRAKQVEALGEGAAFEHDDQIVVVTSQLAAFDVAIEQADYREKTAGEKAARIASRESIVALSALLSKEESERLAILAEAEAACDKLVEAIKRFNSASGGVEAVCMGVNQVLARNGFSVGDFPALYAGNLQARVGNYISSSFRALEAMTRISRMGDLQWSSVPPTSWVKAEERETDGMFRRTLYRDIDKLLASIPEEVSDGE